MLVAVGLSSVEAGALVGVVAFVVRDVVGLAERGGGECGLAGGALGAVAVGGLMVSSTVGTGESLCGQSWRMKEWLVLLLEYRGVAGAVGS